jgi:hypothetical protein
MSFLGKAWDDGTRLVGDAVQVGMDSVMAPAEIARWALDAMFGSGDDLHQIAAELAELGCQIDQLSREIDLAVGQVSWHGQAADAFHAHAAGRVRELRVASDDLKSLSTSVGRLASVL